MLATHTPPSMPPTLLSGSPPGPVSQAGQLGLWALLRVKGRPEGQTSSEFVLWGSTGPRGHGSS